MYYCMSIVITLVTGCGSEQHILINIHEVQDQIWITVVLSVHYFASLILTRLKWLVGKLWFIMRCICFLLFGVSFWVVASLTI